MSDEELFLRLEFFAAHCLYRSEEAYWLTPFGRLLDMMELWKQMTGRAEPVREAYVDELWAGLD